MEPGQLTEALIRLASREARDAAANHLRSAVPALIDTVAAMVPGSRTDAATTVRRALAQHGQGEATVVGSPHPMALLDAVLHNGVAAHALDFDDTVEGHTVHPSCHLVPALLALAERYDVSGRLLLVSYLVGLQAEYVIAVGLGRSHYAAGWHTTGTAGPVATAVAAAQLLDFDERASRAAIATAASSAAGLRANFGTMVKPLHAGHAARSGVEAALLAAAGLTAADDAFGHRFGLEAAMSGDPAAKLPDLFDFGVLDLLVFKPYPCCGEATGAVDAAIDLHRRNGGAVEGKVVLRLHPFAREILEFDRPVSADQARFSAVYCVDVALRTGALVIDDFEEAVFDRERADAAGRRVTVVVDHSLKHTRAATIELESGEVAEVSGERSPATGGLTEVALRHKFLNSTRAVLGDDGSVAMLDDLTGVSDTARMAPVVRRLAVGESD
jgi:2-methylcitrate dehydratase PrpD